MFFSAAEDGDDVGQRAKGLPSRCDCALHGPPAAAGLRGCYALSQGNYVLFHTLVELSAAIISCAVFIFFWNSRQLSG